MAIKTPQIAAASGDTQCVKMMPGADFGKNNRRLAAGSILKVTIPDQSAATKISVTLDLRLYPVEVD